VAQALLPVRFAVPMAQFSNVASQFFVRHRFAEPRLAIYHFPISIFQASHSQAIKTSPLSPFPFREFRAATKLKIPH